MDKLKPTTVSSKTAGEAGSAISTRNMLCQQGIQVVDIGFKNQGTSSTAILKFDGGEIRLASGSKGEGASFSPFIPFGYCDSCDYQVTFEHDGGAAPQVNKLFVGYRFVIKE